MRRKYKIRWIARRTVENTEEEGGESWNEKKRDRGGIEKRQRRDREETEKG